MRKLAGLFALTALAACAVPAPGPLPPAASAVPSAPATTPAPTATPTPEPAESDPYVAPAFDPPPAGSAAGSWRRQLTLPTFTPSPTPLPTPTPLPLATRLPIELPGLARTSAPIGGTISLPYTASGIPAGLPWQLLDPTMGTVEGGSTIRVAKAGPIYAYLEFEGRRHYVLLAGAPFERLQAPASYRYDDRGPFATFIRTHAAWSDFWEAHDPGAAWPEVDFAAYDVLAVRRFSGGCALGDAAVTGVDAGGTADLVLTAVPDSRPCPGAVFGVLDLILIPKAAQARAVRTYDVAPERAWTLPLTGPAGPAPSPTPTPVPQASDAGCGRPAAPPYTPAPLGQAKSCFGPETTLYIGLLDQPVQEAWEAAIRLNQGYPLFATGATFQVADPTRARFEGGNRLFATKPGPVAFTATGNGGIGRGLLAALAAQEPALRFQYRCDWGAPADALPRGPRVFRADDAAWRDLWQSGYLNAPPGVPAVDFTRYDVVALVDDRLSTGDAAPVLTHVSQDRGRVHLVRPGIYTGNGFGYSKSIHLYLTGKLAPKVIVEITDFCGSAESSPQ